MDFDLFLKSHLGQFGIFNVKVYCTLIVVACFATFSAVGHIFTAGRIRSRCFIPECDEMNPEYLPSWVSNAIPRTGKEAIEQCTRFSHNNTTEVYNQSCPVDIFDNLRTENCKDGNVYENTDTVVYEYNLGCNEWQRSAIGTLRIVGTFLGISLWGNLADRWGRKTVLIFVLFITFCIGIIKYWANSYLMFLGLEIFEAFVESGALPCYFILFLELTGPDYRELACAAVLSLNAFGAFVFGSIAWAVQNWRNIILIAYVPQITIIAFYWLLPESPRWLITKGRYDEAEAILKNAAKVNRKNIPDSVYLELRETAKKYKLENKMKKSNEQKEPWLIVMVFKNKPLLVRCLVAPVWWISTVFIHNGLGLNTVNLAGNKYVNYIITDLVDLPGYIMAIFLLKRFGRRNSLAGCFILCGLSQIAYIFVDQNNYSLCLGLYLFGKCVIAVGAVGIYMYTAELFPTKYRQSLFSYSTMMGRVGSTLSFITPALSATVWLMLPSALYGGLALLSSTLMFLTPETKNCNLPDTFEQAVDLGIKKENQKSAISTTTL